MPAHANAGGPRLDEMPLPVAFGLSCLLSALTVAVVILCLQHASIRHVARPLLTRVVLLELPPPPSFAPPPEPLPPMPPIVLPTQPTATIVIPPPTKPPQRERPARPKRISSTARIQQAAPAPQAVSASTAKAAPATQPASDPAARDSLEARIREAIRQAFRFPQAARDMGSHGTAIVGFLYRDRTVSSVRILRSSRSTVLDREAMDIVQRADLPAPGKMTGQTLDLEVPIVFDLIDDD